MKSQYEERFYEIVEQSLNDSAQEWVDSMLAILDDIKEKDTPLYSPSIPKELRDHLIAAHDRLDEETEIEELAQSSTDYETDTD